MVAACTPPAQPSLLTLSMPPFSATQETMQDPDEQLDAQTERVDDLSSMIDHREAALAAFEVRNLENEAAAFAGPKSMEEAFCSTVE